MRREYVRKFGVLGGKVSLHLDRPLFGRDVGHRSSGAALAIERAKSDTNGAA